MEILNKKFDFKAAVKHFNQKNGTRLKRIDISRTMKGSNILLFKEREGSRWTANEIYALAEIFGCKADDLKIFFKKVKAKRKVKKKPKNKVLPKKID